VRKHTRLSRRGARLSRRGPLLLHRGHSLIPMGEDRRGSTAKAAIDLEALFSKNRGPLLLRGHSLFIW
jgi:hypothetical protein